MQSTKPTHLCPSPLTKTIIFLAVLITPALFPLEISALSMNFSSGSDWDSGDKTNLDTSVKEGGMQLNANGAWGARNWKTPDLPLHIGSALAIDGTDIYTMRGLGDVLFWKYSSTDDTWTTLANLPFGTYYGAELEVVDGYIYALFGGYQRSFARYSIADDSWEMLPDAPNSIYRGASLSTDGTDLFILRGTNTQEFWKYTVSSGTWGLLASAPNTMNQGADLVQVGDSLYTPRGNNTATFYRYHIPTNTWSTLTDLPATINDDLEISSDGTYIFVARQNNTNTLYRYDIEEGTWATVTDLPGLARYVGSVYNSSDGYVYMFQGNNSYNFWKYDVDADAFVGPTDVTAGLGTGSDMVYLDGHLYVPRGGNTATLYRYVLASDTWEARTNAPANFNSDMKGVAAGSSVYFLRGTNTATFWRHNPGSNTWTALTDAPATINNGATLAYPGSGDWIYATRGNNTLTFWRYSIDGNSWDAGGVSDLPADAEANIGARLISDGGNDIYYLPGVGVKRWLKYDIDGDIWTELTPPSFSPYYGTDLEYRDGKIIALAGYYKTDVYEYDVADNSWRKLPSLAGNLAQGIGPYNGASLVHDGSGNFYVSRGTAQTSILTYTPGETDYVSSGSWVSAVQDLRFVDSWTSFTSTITTPEDSTIVFETRASADAVSWSDWESVSGSVIASPPQRYLQIRAVFVASTGGGKTPILEAISIEYEGDTTAPNNPDAFTGSSQEMGGVSLTSGESYPYVTPYFTWSGANDGETSVDGYFVYFGTNDLADPEAVGEYQTSTSYIATKPLSTGTYYLRLKTKDAAGNISAATTGFVYDYTGISPAQSITVGSTAEFTGTAEFVEVANDKIKLTGRPGGFWLYETLSVPPATLQYGAKSVAHVTSTNKLYVFRGNTAPTFYEYDIGTDTWATLADAPGDVRMGGGVIEGPSGYLYGLAGNNTTSFWRYNITDDVWSDEDAADAPLTTYYGSSLVYDGSQYIYVLRGNNDDAFWRYNTSEDIWEGLASTDFGAPQLTVNNNSYSGGDLAINQSDQLIYATQGNYLPGFSVYNINTNSWTPLPALPALPNVGSSIEYAPSVDVVFYTPGNSSDKMFVYDVSEQAWSEVSAAPSIFGYGATLRHVDGNLYAVLGGNTTGFYKYNIAKDSWLTPNKGLFGQDFRGVSYLTEHYGADILKGDGTYFYILRGNYADDFVRWDSATGIVTRLANAPMGAYSGSSLVYDSTAEKIYFTGGINLQRLYVYDIATDTWEWEVEDPPPLDANYGSSMVYDGSRYIYFNRGGNANSFYRFDTQGVSGSKWSARANASAALGYGAELLLNGGYIYTLRGQNVANNPFYRYDIEANTWSDPAVADLDVQVHIDGFLTDGGDGNFYAATANNTAGFYKYSLDGDSWTALPDVPARVYNGGAGESNGLDRVFVLAGNGTGSISDGIYTYVMETENSAFEEAGTYTSQSHDLTSVYKWANLVVDYTAAANTNLSIQTRSSQNESDWSSWTSVASSKKLENTYTYQIKSPPARYFQVKFVLTSSDGLYSGVINNYTINYYKDTTLPTNPNTSGLGVYSDNTPGTPLVTDSWYGYAAPYFDWPDAELSDGASDTSTGSGVAGYYVYFGEDEAADPFVDGVFQTTSSYEAGGLTNNSTYYLRAQTVDKAGNVAEEVWQPFIYKYDSSGPSTPGDLTVSPSGYSSVDSFDFSWDAATSMGAAVESYCYKTGATSGDYSVDQCTSDLSVAGVPSYRVGVNTFYVRAKNTAGNYSNYVTASYYYVDSDNAPAPPTNLSVTPTSSTENSFAFSWDPPTTGTYYGTVNNLSYHYSINTLPTAESTTPTILTNLIANPYATVPGENVFYIVTKDEAGNVNYSNYTSVTFAAETTAPGIPLSLDIADVSVKSTGSWKLALSWDPPTSIGSGVSYYAIYRSTDGSTFTKVGESTDISYQNSNLTQQVYYYKIQACGLTCGAFSEVVSMLPDGKYTTAAELLSNPVVSDVTARKAVISWATSRTADSKIAFGTTSGDYFSEEVSNSVQKTAHTLDLSNLSPGTKYYYLARWTDEDGNTGESAEQSFTTLPAPSTEEPTVISIGLDSALVQFTSRNSTKVRVYYGETSAFGAVEEVTVGSGESTHTVQLTDLTDGVKYYFKINSFDSDGMEYEGEIHSFTTLPRPQISNIQVNQVKGTARSTLLVTWESNTEVSSIVTYYPLALPAAARNEINIAFKSGKHQMILADLDPQSSYAILIKGKDVAGNEAVGELQQVTTSADTRPPQISEFIVEGEIIGTGEEATAQLIVSWKTDEPATSQVEFGEGSGTTYSQKTQEDSALSNSHLVVVSGLSPAKVYHLRALAKDQYGNEAQSIDKVVITPKATESALELVITNLSLVFGFLSQ